MEIIRIEPNEIVSLSDEAGKLMFKKDAENALARLLELQKLINEALDKAKEQIVSAATALNPDFRGIEGEQVKVTYRFYGEKYEYDWTKKNALEPFLTRKEYFKVDGKKVDEYLEKVGELPDGIKEKDRTKTPSIKFIGEEDE